MDEVREGSKHDEEVVVVAEGKGKRSSDKGLSDSSYPLTVDGKCSRKFSSQGT